MTLLASRSSSAVSGARIGSTSPAGWMAPAAAGLLLSVPKPPAITLRKWRFIAAHMMYDRIAPLEPTSAPVDDQQIVREHEAGRRRRPAGVAVEHRHHDRHVGAADGHHHVDAEEQRDDGHDDHRRHRVGHAVGIDEGVAEVDDEQQPGEVEQVPRRQQHRLAADPGGELAEGDHGSGEGHGTDQHAEVHLDLVDRVLGRRHADRHRRIDEVGVAHEHRGETHEAVHQRHELGHLRHLHDARGVETHARADHHRREDVRQAGGRDLRAEDRGEHGDRHADDAVEVAAARRFLVGQPAQAQDEEDGGPDVGDRRETGGHVLFFLTCGTFPACAGSRRIRRTC